MTRPIKPVLKPVVAPVEFRPFQGLMAVAERFTRAAEKRLGIDLWDGDDGLSGVTADILRELGVKEKPIPLGTSERVISPRMVAEQCGMVKRRHPKRRLRK